LEKNKQFVGSFIYKDYIYLFLKVLCFSLPRGNVQNSDPREKNKSENSKKPWELSQ